MNIIQAESGSSCFAIYKLNYFGSSLQTWIPCHRQHTCFHIISLFTWESLALHYKNSYCIITVLLTVCHLSISPVRWVWFFAHETCSVIQKLGTKQVKVLAVQTIIPSYLKSQATLLTTLYTRQYSTLSQNRNHTGIIYTSPFMIPDQMWNHMSSWRVRPMPRSASCSQRHMIDRMAAFYSQSLNTNVVWGDKLALLIC